MQFSLVMSCRRSVKLPKAIPYVSNIAIRSPAKSVEKSWYSD